MAETWAQKPGFWPFNAQIMLLGVMSLGPTLHLSCRGTGEPASGAGELDARITGAIGAEVKL